MDLTVWPKQLEEVEKLTWRLEFEKNWKTLLAAAKTYTSFHLKRNKIKKILGLEYERNASSNASSIC